MVASLAGGQSLQVSARQLCGGKAIQVPCIAVRAHQRGAAPALA